MGEKNPLLYIYWMYLAVMNLALSLTLYTLIIIKELKRKKKDEIFLPLCLEGCIEGIPWYYIVLFCEKCPFMGLLNVSNVYAAK